jgi:hypothetical protein
MGGDAPFLSATWRHLAMLNYEVDPAVLAGRVPPGTELDTWHGHALVTLLGLRFLNLGIRGIAIPGHRDFDQINLRFYVRRPMGDGQWRRGVVFVKEVVPKRLIVAVAKAWYGEPYMRLPTRHVIEAPPGGEPGVGGSGFLVRYQWKQRGHWQGMSGRAAGHPAVFAPGSVEEFVTERYWGYRAHRGGGTSEFRTQHPSWLVRPLRDTRLDGDLARLCGPALGQHLRREPHSAFLADGSAVAVFPPRVVPPETFPSAAA